MDRKQQVFLKLKPKTKALGFSSKELKGIAAQIADNLTSAEEASDEDVNAEIDKEIEAALRYLPFGQSQANRLLDEWKKNHPESYDDDDDVDDETSGRQARQTGSNKKNPKNNGKTKDIQSDSIPRNTILPNDTISTKSSLSKEKIPQTDQ